MAEAALGKILFRARQVKPHRTFARDNALAEITEEVL